MRLSNSTIPSASKTPYQKHLKYRYDLAAIVEAKHHEAESITTESAPPMTSAEPIAMFGLESAFELRVVS